MYSEKFEQPLVAKQWTKEPEQVYATCSHCEEELEGVPYTKEQIFCSQECENEYHITEAY